MAKKKTEDKELKPKAMPKKEAVKVEIPNTPKVDIILNKDGKTYNVGNELAHILINSKRAKLA
jgi:hypothetical protein